VKAAREAWFAAQPDLDPDKLVFLDATAAATNMARRYGRAPGGEHCRLLVPQSHYKTTTLTAALRTTGLCTLDLADGATNGQRFRDDVANRLVPVLRPGDIVILDNLQAHKVSGMRERVEAPGCSTFRPKSRVQPDRTDLRQAESPAAERNRPPRAGPLGRHPARLHPLHPRRVPQQPRRRRLRQRLGRRYVSGDGSRSNRFSGCSDRALITFESKFILLSQGFFLVNPFDQFRKITSGICLAYFSRTSDFIEVCNFIIE
jgi:hypothetical protein